jgi:hypothetical protein
MTQLRENLKAAVAALSDRLALAQVITRNGLVPQGFGALQR